MALFRVFQNIDKYTGYFQLLLDDINNALRATEEPLRDRAPCSSLLDISNVILKRLIEHDIKTNDWNLSNSFAKYGVGRIYSTIAGRECSQRIRLATRSTGTRSVWILHEGIPNTYEKYMLVHERLEKMVSPSFYNEFGISSLEKTVNKIKSDKTDFLNGEYLRIFEREGEDAEGRVLRSSSEHAPMWKTCFEILLRRTRQGQLCNFNNFEALVLCLQHADSEALFGLRKRNSKGVNLRYSGSISKIAQNCHRLLVCEVACFRRSFLHNVWSTLFDSRKGDAQLNSNYKVKTNKCIFNHSTTTLTSPSKSVWEAALQWMMVHFPSFPTAITFFQHSSTLALKGTANSSREIMLLSFLCDWVFSNASFITLNQHPLSCGDMCHAWSVRFSELLLFYFSIVRVASAGNDRGKFCTTQHSNLLVKSHNMWITVLNALSRIHSVSWQSSLENATKVSQGVKSETRTSLGLIWRLQSIFLRTKASSTLLHSFIHLLLQVPDEKKVRLSLNHLLATCTRKGSRYLVPALCMIIFMAYRKENKKDSNTKHTSSTDSLNLEVQITDGEYLTDPDDESNTPLEKPDVRDQTEDSSGSLLSVATKYLLHLSHGVPNARQVNHPNKSEKKSTSSESSLHRGRRNLFFRTKNREESHRNLCKATFHCTKSYVALTFLHLCARGHWSATLTLWRNYGSILVENKKSLSLHLRAVLWIALLLSPQPLLWHRAFQIYARTYPSLRGKPHTTTSHEFHKKEKHQRFSSNMTSNLPNPHEDQNKKNLDFLLQENSNSFLPTILHYLPDMFLTRTLQRGDWENALLLLSQHFTFSTGPMGPTSSVKEFHFEISPTYFSPLLLEECACLALHRGQWEVALRLQRVLIFRLRSGSLFGPLRTHQRYGAPWKPPSGSHWEGEEEEKKKVKKSGPRDSLVLFPRVTPYYTFSHCGFFLSRYLKAMLRSRSWQESLGVLAEG